MASVLYPFLTKSLCVLFFFNINFQENLGGFKAHIFRLAFLDEIQDSGDKDIKKNEGWQHTSRKKHFSPFTDLEFSN